ncbi:MAG TPA: hypothetical protein VFK44_01715 [Bacillales bacterium]|nr:hypothetical protein [Bacillales bacterium]
MNGKDREDLEQILGEYDVEFPSETQITATIDALRPHVPEKKRKTYFFYKKMRELLRTSTREFSTIHPLFWAANGLFFALGLVILFAENLDPYLTVMFLSPFPLIFGLLEVLKSQSEGMAELEMSLKHSLQEVMLSKMVIVGGYNLLLNVLMTLIVPFFADDIWLWKLILHWMTPFTVFSAIAFAAVGKIKRSAVAVSATVVIWAAVSYGIILSEQATHWLESIQTIYYAALNMLAVAVFILQFYRMMRKGDSVAIID